jgi:hypothetical protein
MELVRQTIENVVNEYKRETVENFVFPSPSKDELEMVAPFLKDSGLTPAAAHLVLVNFDRDPKDISTLDLENRVKLLKVIYKLLDNEDLVDKMVLKNMKKDDVENADGMIKVLKRIINLLIMESNTAHSPIEETQKSPVEQMYEKKIDRMQSYTSYSFIFILSFVIIFLCAMINGKKI